MPQTNHVIYELSPEIVFFVDQCQTPMTNHTNQPDNYLGIITNSAVRKLPQNSKCINSSHYNTYVYTTSNFVFEFDVCAVSMLSFSLNHLQ